MRTQCLTSNSEKERPRGTWKPEPLCSRNIAIYFSVSGLLSAVKGAFKHLMHLPDQSSSMLLANLIWLRPHPAQACFRLTQSLCSVFMKHNFCAPLSRVPSCRGQNSSNGTSFYPLFSTLFPRMPSCICSPIPMLQCSLMRYTSYQTSTCTE